jgi:hypothetical protein
MGMVCVPRAEVAELVGVAPDASDETLQAAIEKTPHRQAVQAAIDDGRITAADGSFWRNEMSAAPAPPRITRAVMAAQASHGSRGRPVTEIDADPAYRSAMWAMGFREGVQPPEERCVVYPSVDDEYGYELVDNGDGTGYWSAGAVRASERGHTAWLPHSESRRRRPVSGWWPT